ncbi:MAG: hypothetical protein J7L23_03230 [Candidatus Diapherotrites archaeon]|nr:hypothetical protein [Candidatus Diapherotrites archaeon]
MRAWVPIAILLLIAAGSVLVLNEVFSPNPTGLAGLYLGGDTHQGEVNITARVIKDTSEPLINARVDGDNIIITVCDPELPDGFPGVGIGPNPDITVYIDGNKIENLVLGEDEQEYIIYDFVEYLSTMNQHSLMVTVSDSLGNERSITGSIKEKSGYRKHTFYESSGSIYDSLMTTNEELIIRTHKKLKADKIALCVGRSYLHIPVLSCDDKSYVRAYVDKGNNEWIRVDSPFSRLCCCPDLKCGCAFDPGTYFGWVYPKCNTFDYAGNVTGFKASVKTGIFQSDPGIWYFKAVVLSKGYEITGFDKDLSTCGGHFKGLLECKEKNEGDSCSDGRGICCNGECITPDCSSDSDCGTSDECTTYECMNPGTCEAKCEKIVEDDCENCAKSGEDCSNDMPCCISSGLTCCDSGPNAGKCMTDCGGTTGTHTCWKCDGTTAKSISCSASDSCGTGDCSGYSLSSRPTCGTDEPTCEIVTSGNPDDDIGLWLEDWHFAKYSEATADKTRGEFQVVASAPSGKTLDRIACTREGGLADLLPITKSVSGQTATANFNVWEVVGDDFSGEDNIVCQVYTSDDSRGICTSPQKVKFTQFDDCKLNYAIPDQSCVVEISKDISDIDSSLSEIELKRFHAQIKSCSSHEEYNCHERFYLGYSGSETKYCDGEYATHISMGLSICDWYHKYGPDHYGFKPMRVDSFKWYNSCQVYTYGHDWVDLYLNLDGCQDYDGWSDESKCDFYKANDCAT